MQVSQDFQPALERWDLAELDAHAGAVYGVDSDLRLQYFNAAWFRFAEANGGEPRITRQWSLGRSLLDCVPEPVRDVYAGSFRACLDAETPWRTEYECSSQTHYRRFHQIVYGLDDRAGLLIVNSLVVETVRNPTAKTGMPPNAAAYFDANGIVTQCSHCRRVQHLGEIDRWDWIRNWVDDFPRETSHGVCTPCFRFHYSAAR